MESASAEKQGIVVAILGTDEGRERVRPSLRRTLSADMSSKKWAAQNGICLSTPMKKIASFIDLRLNPILDSFSSSEDEEEEEDDESGIKNEFDVWNSIISQNKSSDKSLPPPYVHPLVKRSSSSLSEKSLQICTESLGSETGSDGFSSSYAESEFLNSLDSETEKEEVDEEVEEEEDYSAVKFGSGRKSPAARSFPPPLPSLSSRRGGDGGPMLHMRTRRDNGRLVVEAITVPASQPNFAAERIDGRLVLKFAKTNHEDLKNEQCEEQFASEIKTEMDEEVQKAVHEEVRKKIGNHTESRLINFHRLALMANKPIGFLNRKNPSTSWHKEYSVQEENEEHHEKPSQLATSLPLRPCGPVGRLIPPPASAKVSTTAAASFNHYNYFWRAKINDSNDNKLVFKNQTTENDKRELVVLRGNSYLVPLLKGCCKQQPRTLIWEPRCVATS